MATTGLSSFITILPAKVKTDQHTTHPNINNSPIPIFPCKITCGFPLEITIRAPAKEMAIPIKLNLLNFSLNIKFESIAVKAGFKDAIIEARLAVINFNPKKRKKLLAAIPVIPKNKINRV